MPHRADRLREPLLCITFLALSACIEPGITQTVEGVSLEDVRRVSEVVSVQAVSSALATVPRADGESITVGVSEQFSVTRACEVSGTLESTIAYAGQFDGRTGAADLELQVNQAHNACQVTGPAQASTISIDGNPTGSASFVLSVADAGAFEVTGTMQGQLNWTSGERTTTCPFRIDFAGSGTGLDDVGNLNVQGSVCGLPLALAASLPAS
jgi:hypothetical protein